jgi:hypothetical protein
MATPTKQEILDKYKDKISAADFEVLAGASLPTPKELQDQGVFLEFWGRLKDYAVWAKRTLGGVLLALILLHDGWETYRDFSPYAIKAYDQVQTYVTQLVQHKSEPATDYIVFAPEQKPPAPSFPPTDADFVFSGSIVHPVSGSWGVA